MYAGTPGVNDMEPTASKLPLVAAIIFLIILFVIVQKGDPMYDSSEEN